MTLEFIGLVGAHETSESDAGNGQVVDLPFIKAFAQTQAYAGFDKVLLAVNTRAPDSMIIASYVAALTDKLGLLVAIGPAFRRRPSQRASSPPSTSSARGARRST